MEGTLKSLKIKFHTKKLAISKKNICPCLSLLERSFQPLLFSFSNSSLSSAPSSFTSAMQQYSTDDWRVFVVVRYESPGCTFLGFHSTAKDSGFFAFPTAQQEHGVVLVSWAFACAKREWSHLGLQRRAASETRPACPCPVSEPALSCVRNCPSSALCIRLCMCLIPGLRNSP